MATSNIWQQSGHAQAQQHGDEQYMSPEQAQHYGVDLDSADEHALHAQGAPMYTTSSLDNPPRFDDNKALPVTYATSFPTEKPAQKWSHQPRLPQNGVRRHGEIITNVFSILSVFLLVVYTAFLIVYDGAVVENVGDAGHFLREISQLVSCCSPHSCLGPMLTLRPRVRP